MQQTIPKKTITATIKKTNIDGKLTSLSPPETSKEKLELARHLLDIPENFNDNIDVIYQNNEIIFKWQPPKFDVRAEKYHKSALILARKGHLNEAIEQWMQAATINSTDPDYFFNLGVAYFEQKKFQDAIENLSRVLAICPFYFKAHIILGTAFLKLRKFEFAKKHLLQSIKYDQTNKLAYLNLGAVHSILKEYDEGIAMFEKAISLAPDEPRAYLGLAKIYSTIGNTEKANYYFKKVIDLDKKGNLANYAKRSIVILSKKIDKAEVSDSSQEVTGNPEEYYSEGYHYYISGNYTKSASMYEKYLTLKPNDDYVWYALGEAQIRSGKPEKALESFKNAIKQYPKKGLYFKELAVVFDILNKSEKVIAAASQAKELGKADSVTYCLWGKALYQLGKFEEAIPMLEKSVELNRNNFLAKFYLAQSHLKNKEPEEAIDYLHELKDVEINTPLKKKAEALYQKITLQMS